MDPTQTDVNNTPASSAGDPGVTAVPPAAEPDVNQTLQDPSAEGTLPAGAPPAKPHEDTVPYERFSEVNEKLKQMEAALEAAKAQTLPPEPPPPEPDNGQPPDFQALGLAPDPNAPAPAQGPFPYNDQVEEQVRDGIYSRPLATMDPIFREWYRQEKMKENQVRRIPDFQQYEPSFYQIPDEIVYQTQANPEVVRFLIAKHQATLQGRTPPPPPASMQNNQAVSPAPAGQPALSQEPPKTMEELKKQWKAEGERDAIAKLRNQSGVTSEPASTVTTPPGDEPELDEYGKQFMKNLGIKEEDMSKVAKRLQG